MTELVFLKLGGSLITDKTRPFTVRSQVLARLAQEVAAARVARPELRLVVAHGSGSFGHFAAQESGFDRARNVLTSAAYAKVSAAAATLNTIVRAALLDVGLPAVSLPPSASALVRGGDLAELAVEPYERLLAWNAIPLTYGDVALRDEGEGTIVSTETVFRFLARHLRPGRLILLGEVEGVYAGDPHAKTDTPVLIPRISRANWDTVQDALGGARGADVTGGMRAKVAEMLALCELMPDLDVRIASGMRPRLLEQLLLRRDQGAGTTIRA
ncbi:MAG TPA: isopentenyl phosphate kinase [Ardenticatenaceae bacterium]|nr:isopentenyl phosphate kinase [Ardenticatenaceae bacterium]